jgi:hypothetical protein
MRERGGGFDFCSKGLDGFWLRQEPRIEDTESNWTSSFLIASGDDRSNRVITDMALDVESAAYDHSWLEP